MKTAIIATSIIALVCAGFLAGYFLNLQSNTASDLPENLVITNVELGTDNSEYWIAITVNNTGLSSVNIVKLLFNNVKQSSVIPSLPIALAPDAGTVIKSTLDITASEYQTDALNIDVITSKGNTFSKVFTQPQTIGFMDTEQVAYSAVAFDSGTNTVRFNLKNTGTSPLIISYIYINDAAATVTTGYKALPATLEANTVATTFNVTVSSIVAGGNYEIKVVTAKNNPFPYTAVATS
jgi:hypothetical protein